MQPRARAGRAPDKTQRGSLGNRTENASSRTFDPICSASTPGNCPRTEGEENGAGTVVGDNLHVSRIFRGPEHARTKPETMPARGANGGVVAVVNTPRDDACERGKRKDAERRIVADPLDEHRARMTPGHRGRRASDTYASLICTAYRWKRALSFEFMMIYALIRPLLFPRFAAALTQRAFVKFGCDSVHGNFPVPTWATVTRDPGSGESLGIFGWRARLSRNWENFCGDSGLDAESQMLAGFRFSFFK